MKKNSNTTRPARAGRQLLWTRSSTVHHLKQQQQPQQKQQQDDPIVPPEFPGLVYDVLRAFPDAMAAVDKAAQEFYARRAPR